MKRPGPFAAFYVRTRSFRRNPVYGSNNWYYAYGNSSEKEILQDTDYLLELTKGAENPPYMVIDDCWQEHHRLDEYNGGPWRNGNEKFPDMAGLAAKIKEKGSQSRNLGAPSFK